MNELSRIRFRVRVRVKVRVLRVIVVAFERLSGLGLRRLGIEGLYIYILGTYRAHLPDWDV